MTSTATQAEGLLNALRGFHSCDSRCIGQCTLNTLDPNLPADRDMIEALASDPLLLTA